MVIRNTRLIEDDGDFIEINGMKLPKDYVLNVLSKAKDFGLDSPETVIANKKAEEEKKAKAEEEKKAEAEREAEKERKALVQKGTELYNSFVNIFNDNSLKLQSKLNKLDDLLVPASGKADTVAGELIRAIQRILYRDYNDGDRFYTGYGLETCAPSVAYIIDTLDNFEINEIFDNLMHGLARGEVTDSEYTKELEEVAICILEDIYDDRYMFTQIPENSRNYTSSTLYDIIENDKNHEFEIYLGDVESYVENGCISYSDVKDFLDELCSYYGGEVYDAYGSFIIQNLSGEQVEQWEEMYDKELESYLEDLESEYPNYGLDEEEEDY